ncbi:hypothetical protein ACH4PU_30335 [Streptomyces sp. NPDC021100]|uniref:hypothetical protein n=1 Tax=Streptomyces sp. NPDC021100 TaxID=3365114 RepID=UPI0037AAFBB4
MPRSFGVDDPIGAACGWFLGLGSVAVLGLLGHLAQAQLAHGEHTLPQPVEADAPDTASDDVW